MMTVGDLAARAGVSVRTLQFYDQKGLLTPSGHSAKGKRLYSAADETRLQQILLLKYLGLSLEDIGQRLPLLQTTEQVVNMLEEQAKALRVQMEGLSQAETAISRLREEVVQMGQVDWRKYMDILTLLQQNSSQYWVVKYFDQAAMNHFAEAFGDTAAESFQMWNDLCQRIEELQRAGATPDSPEGLVLARDWWDMVTQATGGDPHMLQTLLQFNEQKEGWQEDFRSRQEAVEGFLGQALAAYFEREGMTLPQEVHDETHA